MTQRMLRGIRDRAEALVLARLHPRPAARVAPRTTAGAPAGGLSRHDADLDRVHRAGDARVVVADRLLAPVGEVVVVDVRPTRSASSRRSRLDARLVLRRRRHDLRVLDDPVVVDHVAVEEHAARGLGGAEALAGPRRTGTDGAAAVDPAVDDPQRLARTPRRARRRAR